MAWRIDEAVERGEIDNRQRGRVRGRIWFVGREAPVELNLEGNAWRDLAGQRLTFSNPQPKLMDLADLATVQSGLVGDITASHKVKVPDIPMEEVDDCFAAERDWPWHWGNVLHLEWFSNVNGRVVIESPLFELRIEGDSAWVMTEAEETAQREANGQAMTAFFERLGMGARREEYGEEDLGADDEDEADAELAWDEDDEADEATDDEVADERDASWRGEEEAPMTEAEAEAWQVRQDLLLDRIQARLEREGDEADYEQILSEELERMCREFGEPELPREGEPGYVDLDELYEEAEQALEEAGPEGEDELRYVHPLVRRASSLFHALYDQADAEDWVPEDAQSEHPVRELLNAAMCVGPKLAGALNGGHWPPSLEMCALTIVRLKRAHGYVDDALTALESCQEDRLIPVEAMGPTLVELVDIGREIRRLIGGLRRRLGEDPDRDEDPASESTEFRADADDQDDDDAGGRGDRRGPDGRPDGDVPF